MKINFTKMHGAGNDFIIINGFEVNINNFSLTKFAKKYCHRNFGIGADGVVLILPSDKQDFRMRIFNADGGEPEMCGNAIRCMAFYVYKHNLIASKKMRIDTLAGLIVPEIINVNGANAVVKIDMGKPKFSPEQIPVNISEQDPIINYPIDIEGTECLVTLVSMGNPHAVIFTEDTENFPVKKIGAVIESHSLFSNKINVEFVQVLSRKELKMRVWERGTGETLACGTGACASVVAAILQNKADNKATVQLPGGDLIIEWSLGGNVIMSGPAEIVFEGTIE